MSVSTRTKIQLRSFALTTTVLTAVIFHFAARSPPGQRLAPDAPLDDGLKHDRNHDHEPEAELGVEGVDAGGNDAGVDRADDVGGDEGAHDRAGPSEH